jgi:hypothetical protein
MLMALRDRWRNRSQTKPASIKERGTMLARRLLASVAGGETDWAAFGRDGMRGQPWRIEDGASADGAERLAFLSPSTSWLQTRRLSMSRALDQLFKK